MAKRCERKQQKRISAQKAMKTARKGAVWVTKVKAGPHRKAESIPLAFLIKEILKLANNKKETKAILNTGKVKVNGVPRKSAQFPVGLFDVVSIELEGKSVFYRIIYDKKGRLIPYESKDAKELLKISKVKDKRIVKGGKMQITTDDGIVFINPRKNINVDDSLLIKHPEKEILEVIEMKKGNLVYKMSGRNVGKVAKLKEINKGTAERESLVTLEYAEGEVATMMKKIIAVGKGKLAIDLGVEE